MTKTAGSYTLATPCCGRHYSFPIYKSFNLSAFEYWTDGWRERSLMPNDEGLRHCDCGAFVMLKDLIKIDSAQKENAVILKHVSDDALPECIAQAQDENMEMAARMEYWRSLNHAYRSIYRKHRDNEEAATKAKWHEARLKERRWWDKILGRAMPSYARPADSPFTYPAFEPTKEQTENMVRLAGLIVNSARVADDSYIVVLAELYRELKLFENAGMVISKTDKARLGFSGELIAKLILKKECAPMCYCI